MPRPTGEFHIPVTLGAPPLQLAALAADAARLGCRVVAFAWRGAAGRPFPHQAIPTRAEMRRLARACGLDDILRRLDLEDVRDVNATRAWLAKIHAARAAEIASGAANLQLQQVVRATGAEGSDVAAFDLVSVLLGPDPTLLQDIDLHALDPLGVIRIVNVSGVANPDALALPKRHLPANPSRLDGGKKMIIELDYADALSASSDGRAYGMNASYARQLNGLAPAIADTQSTFAARLTRTMNAVAAAGLPILLSCGGPPLAQFRGSGSLASITPGPGAPRVPPLVAGRLTFVAVPAASDNQEMQSYMTAMSALPRPVASRLAAALERVEQQQSVADGSGSPASPAPPGPAAVFDFPDGETAQQEHRLRHIADVACLFEALTGHKDLLHCNRGLAREALLAADAEANPNGVQVAAAPVKQLALASGKGPTGAVRVDKVARAVAINAARPSEVTLSPSSAEGAATPKALGSSKTAASVLHVATGPRRENTFVSLDQAIALAAAASTRTEAKLHPQRHGTSGRGAACGDVRRAESSAAWARVAATVDADRRRKERLQATTAAPSAADAGEGTRRNAAPAAGTTRGVAAARLPPSGAIDRRRPRETEDQDETVTPSLPSAPKPQPLEVPAVGTTLAIGDLMWDEE